ncbi:winged helix DNA-binding domain-containing protein [Tenggerimyces flavus]|uniref:Winged helix DNA-binding domain-containing protein n=1 Tax=Tenggerimyces flavus TaxID=1708749 RepID=A0ABV7YJN1_9ACTN|nr:winged helix DNA-binding domain-containing protein [Tenggerimyces flavus]MBM7787585.1 hypothetical protein [Tenggerimyces flavus]
MRTIDVAERRARVAKRQRIAAPFRTDDVAEAARSVVALHGTDPATVYLSAWARLKKPTVEQIEQALYVDRTLVRLLGMRRTMFVPPRELAPVIQASSARAIAVEQRKLLIRHLGVGSDIEDAATFLDDVAASTVRALEVRKEAFAQELSTDEPRLKTKLRMAQGKSYEAEVNITTRVLFLLSAEGKIIRGRPRGTWLSSQYRWTTPEVWLGEHLDTMTTEEAKVELVRAWLSAFGPGTIADLRWWTKWTAADVKRALATLEPTEVDLGNGTIGLVLNGDDAPTKPAVKPWLTFLPALDPTTMGWQQREWYLGEHGKRLFDTNGNAGPTIWADGRVVGGWAQRKSGEVVYQFLEDVGSEHEWRAEQEAERLTRWLGDVCVIPRFRTPLERELSA